MRGMLFLLFISAVLTLIIGEIPFSEVGKSALERLTGNSQAWNPLLDERLPRWIVLVCTGASLAVSGAVMQALFQNPLASPSILGISCGGSLAIVLLFVSGLQNQYPYAIPLTAIGGCLFTLLILYMLTRHHVHTSIHQLILTGLALSSLFLALQGTILYALRDNWGLIQLITEWEAGTTMDRNWQHVHMQLPLTIVGLAGVLTLHREIDLLSLGDEAALNLGVEVAKVRWQLFFCISLLIGGALAAVGIIAFFGLVLPHLIRLQTGSIHGKMLPGCILIGGAFLVLLDLGLRAFNLYALSLGNVSAILGGVFLIIFLRKSIHRAYA